VFLIFTPSTQILGEEISGL